LAIFPVRNLASKGILRDPSPYQLDLEAWSQGLGVRFHANKVQSAPIFRLIQDSLSSPPQEIFGYEPSTGYDMMFVYGQNGSVGRYQDLTYSDVSAVNSVGAITITASGSGYSVSAPPTVTFSAASGTGAVTATGVAIISLAGLLVGILVTNTGWYPTGTPPTITIGSGTATATCTLGYPTTYDPRAPTGTFLGDVQYINQPSRQPIYYAPESTTFQTLPNMECAWTCRSLRAFGDFLIALNVTKPSTWTSPFSGVTQAGGSFPNMVKWSDLVFDGNVPDSWDPDNPNTSAGENPLDQITTPIVDGLAMRQTFLIYTENSIWGMEQTGTQAVFQWQQLFATGGLLAPNCVAEVDGIHYAFGPTDIYKTDGVSKISIVDKRNRETIYRNLNIQNAEACFAQYIPHLDSVLFAYQSGDTTFTWAGGKGCNAGALYDIANDTWGFVALPNVTGFAMANADMVYTYSSVPSGATYDNFGGSYYDQQNTFRKSAVAVSDALPITAGGNQSVITNSRLLGYDFMTLGWMGFNYLPEVNQPAFVQRTGMALDQMGSNLTTYKRLRRIFPLVTCYDNVPIQVTIGYSNTPSGAVTWGQPISYDPVTQYKCDTITGGRYLALQFTVPTPVDFEIAGFDCDISDGGRR
jgi:hypothetical protein